MKRQVGLWIDHRKAVIVSITEHGEATTSIQSDMEKHVRFSGSAEIKAEDQQDRKFSGQLAKYYDQVIATIRDAESILILGPGEAKVELKERLDREGLGNCIAGIETADKMTDRQIVAHVKNRFAK